MDNNKRQLRQINDCLKRLYLVTEIVQTISTFLTLGISIYNNLAIGFGLRMTMSDGYYAVLVKYADLICENVANQIKIHI